VIATPREAAEFIALGCAACGVGAILVFAAAFAEAGARRFASEVSPSYGMPICGRSRRTRSARQLRGLRGAHLFSMPDRCPLRPNAIGIVTQSGSLGFLLAHAVARGVSVSHVLTEGNSCEVDVADRVAYLAQDQNVERLPACSRAWLTRDACFRRPNLPEKPTSHSSSTR
jgi:acetate---CoA ligase (ADP-forming)